MKILTCNSNRPLAEAICAYLNLPLTKASVRRFSDMEVFVEIHENVRGEDVFIIQSTSYPANDNLMELLVTLDALKRSSTRRATAVIPYYGYARQDRKSGSRTPISAKLVANLITTAGADRVLTLDLHAGQIQGFFDIPTDNLFSAPVFVKDIRERYDGKDLCIVSPDVGGVVRARAIAKRLEADLAIIDKRRERAGVSEVMNIIGEVEGKRIVIFDDMIDTAGTLCGAANAVKQRGAKSIVACATHPVLSGPAIERLREAPIEKLVVTDTIPTTAVLEKMSVISVAPLLGEAINRIFHRQSVSSLFGR
jgi:ribose-phosphate pyrophosphokinase